MPAGIDEQTKSQTKSLIRKNDNLANIKFRQKSLAPTKQIRQQAHSHSYQRKQSRELSLPFCEANEVLRYPLRSWQRSLRRDSESSSLLGRRKALWQCPWDPRGKSGLPPTDVTNKATTLYSSGVGLEDQRSLVESQDFHHFQ